MLTHPSSLAAAHHTAPTWPRDRNHRSSSTVLAAASAIVLLAVVLLVLAPRTAAAHDQLLSSSPAKDSTTDSVPTEIELVLSEVPLATGAQLVLTTPDGATIPAQEPAVETTHGTVTFPVTGDGPPGTYTVAWHVVSSDGHPIEGTFDFTVKPEPAAKASSSASPTNPDSAASAAPETPTASPQVAQSQSAAATAAGASDRSFPDPLLVVAVVVVVAVAVLVAVTFLGRRRDAAHGLAGSPGDDLLDGDSRQ